MNDTKRLQNDAVGDSEEDRRKSRRHRVLKSGLASYNHDNNTIACVVRNVNETGARIDFDAFASIPETFMLHVGIDGYRVECRRIWRNGKACGVKFIGEKEPTPIFHIQKVDTAENALSSDVLRAMELHQQAGNAEEHRPAVVEISGRRPKPSKPSFGRRE